MLTHSRMPAYVRRARAGYSWPRHFAALVRGCLLIAIVLCAFVHGPDDDTHRPPTTPAGPVAVPVVAEPAAGHETPHGPHGHHTAEQCVPAGVLRAPAAQATDQPQITHATPPLAGIAAITAGPLRPGRRRPHRRRRARTGRTALVRTSRWRI